MFETDEKHLTSDRESHLIHIIDQDGYLRYIDKFCGLHLWGLQRQPHRSPVEQK